MVCERYKEALIEAATTVVLPPELREHFDNCGDCRAAFAMERTLVNAIDIGLQADANAEVSAAFLSRVQARVVEEMHRRRRQSATWVWTIAAASTAVLLFVIGFPLLKSKQNQQQLIFSRTTTPDSAARSTVTTPTIHDTSRNNVAAQRAAPAGQTVQNSTGTTVTPRGMHEQPATQQRSKGPFFGGAEVIVPPDEREALARFVAAAEETKRLASAFLSPGLKNNEPLELSALEIGELQLQPLDQSTDSTDFLGHTHRSRR
jgi:hypothetical protein